MAVAKGTEQLGVGIDAELLQAFREFVKRRGETIREAVELALRRHMANPPPIPELPPLPPVTVPTVESAKPEPKKPMAKRGKAK